MDNLLAYSKINSVEFEKKPFNLVEIGRNGEDSCPVFYVRDNGIGIQPQGDCVQAFQALA